MSTINRLFCVTLIIGLVMFGITFVPRRAAAQDSDASKSQVVNIFEEPVENYPSIIQAKEDTPAGQDDKGLMPKAGAEATSKASNIPVSDKSASDDAPLPLGTPQGGGAKPEVSSSGVNQIDPATPENAPQSGMSLESDADAVPAAAPAEDPFAKYREQFEKLDSKNADSDTDSDTASKDQRVSQSLTPTASIEKTPQELETEIRKEAFNAAVNGFLPLRPEEIRRFLEIYDEAKQASNTPIYPHPVPESRVEEVTLDPADPPPVINLAMGHVTTISFLDVTGARWPIGSMTWAGDFDISTPEEGGGIFKIIPLSDFAYGNVSINLLNVGAPVILTLKAQREKVDVRFDVQIPQEGPFAKPALIGTNRAPKTKAGAVTMTSFLDGTPPDGAVAMQVTGADSRTRAYRMNEKIYLRTPLNLISPAWDASSQSADGMNIYVLGDTPVLLLSNEGKVERVFLDDHEKNSSL